MMNEQDRKFVEAAKAWLEGKVFRWRDEKTIVTLVAIIDRLDKELAEAGTRAVGQHDTIMNYREEVEHLKAQLAEVKDAGKVLLGERQHPKDFRRLAEALKGVGE